MSTCDYCLSDKDLCSKRRSEKHLSVTLHVTDRCNDICEYCWHKDKNEFKNRDMNEEDVDLMFNTLIEQFPEYDISLMFLGGEPTLNPNIIDYSLNKLRDLKSKYYGTIITNGVDISKEFIDLLSVHKNLKINVSLPNKNTSSYNIRLNNIDNYILMQNKYKIHYTLVITEHDIENGIYNNILYWKNRGIKDISLLFEFNSFETIKNQKEYKIKLQEELLKIKDLQDHKFIIKNFQSGLKKEYITDKLYKLAYFSDRKFYMNSKSKFFNNNSIGNINDGIDMDEYFHILKSICCYGCKYNSLCNYDIGLFLKDNKQIINNSFCLPKKILMEMWRNE